MNSDINFEERVLESINFPEFMYLISFFYILQMLCSFKTGPINFEKRILEPINVQESMYIVSLFFFWDFDEVFTKSFFYKLHTCSFTKTGL